MRIVRFKDIRRSWFMSVLLSEADRQEERTQQCAAQRGSGSGASELHVEPQDTATWQ